MSRKDYIKMAELLRGYKERLPRQEFDELVMDVALLFKRENTRCSISMASPGYSQGTLSW